MQNITRATAAGLFAGTYHFARPDVIVGTVNSDGSTVTVANTGADEADHFIQMAGPWMRPGYLPPMYDFEAGQSQRTAEQMAQFSLDFSNRIYQVMGIRPSIYSNGSYNGTLASASALVARPDCATAEQHAECRFAGVSDAGDRALAEPGESRCDRRAECPSEGFLHSDLWPLG